MGLSLRYILRQRLSRLHDAKVLLVFAHAFILVNFFLELLRGTLPFSIAFMQFYAVGTLSLVLWTGIVLTALAYIVYCRPPEPTMGDRIVGLATKRLFPFGLSMLIFIAYLVAVDAFLVVKKPFVILIVRDWTGSAALIPRFDNSLLLLGLLAFGGFLLLPSMQYVLAIRKLPNRSTRRAIAVFIGGWDLIAFDSLLIFGYLPLFAIDAVGPGQLVAGLLLLMTGLAARRNSILEDLIRPLESVQPVGSVPKADAGARRRAPASSHEGSALLEADPAFNYEVAVRDFAEEMLATGRIVFVITAKTSPVYIRLKEVAGIRFFLFSESAYPKPSERPLEVLVPRNDPAALLNIIDEAISSAPEQSKAMVFDNISSFVLDSGFGDTYKFLRQANEILSQGEVTSIFIILSKAHDERDMNLIRRLYSGQLSYDASGLRVTKR
ncbi:MAG: hypothetical protein ACRD6W_02640 [Nitrososphaerales archaeon]